ncbi:MAG: Cytochrome c oxidase caa3-type, assembly factor CtaG-related protein [Solirubrobacterales bacterium]|jgi:putative membrane protein|nr:Cytochrome c oxidase caa3-type, assembly factor CtaG-related protein [Solirubrobacterales bacterium]
MSPNASWTVEPGAIALVLVLGAIYVRRWRQVRATSGARTAGGWRMASFMAGLVGILVALVSPIDRLAEQVLAMHMVQHVILLDFVPILLILGLTKTIMRPLTRRLQPVEHGPLGHPVVAVTLYVGSMWLWHVPALYNAAARYSGIHVLEHICFLTAGTLYWWHLIGPLRTRLNPGGLSPVGYMVSTKILVGLLGIVLTFAPNAIYAFYADQPDYWGMSPTDDQAVAGLIMALEQSIVMGIALTWLFARMITESEKQEQRKERYADATDDWELEPPRYRPRATPEDDPPEDRPTGAGQHERFA